MAHLFWEIRRYSHRIFLLAPPVGLEPTTPWLTVMCSTDWAKEEYLKVAWIQTTLFCVGYDLSFRTVSSQVFSALQSLTSVFGMGTGGPFALKKPTRCQRWPIFPSRLQLSIFGTAKLNFRVRNGNGWTLCVKNTDLMVHLQGFEPGTHWLRVSCSTNWAKGANLGTLQWPLKTE